MKKMAILQSNYIPWKGYFDMIAAVDESIFYYYTEYMRLDWHQNREKIALGVQCLNAITKFMEVRYPKLENRKVYA